jgi:hypothetical protein
MTMKIKIAIGVLLVVVVAVVAISLLAGGDDKDDEPTTAQDRSGGGGGDDGDDESEDAAPRLRTTAVKRSEGTNAAASASSFAERPKEFWLRVSAAPKQRVKGSWNVSCTGGGTDQDTFEVTPPYLVQLRIPTKNAKSCVAGTFAQLTGKGRIKVAILRER